VFGVVGIILASLGLLNGCCGLGSPLLLRWLVGFMEGQEGVTEQDIQRVEAAIPPMAWIMPASLVTLALSVILLIGAIRLLRRLSSGIGLCKLWAWLTIPWSLVGFVANMVFQLQVPKDAQQLGGIGPYLGLAIGGCWVLVLGVGFPLFMLYWFMREPVRAEIADWGQDRPGII
jgi:hypothetical protein